MAKKNKDGCGVIEVIWKGTTYTLDCSVLAAVPPFDAFCAAEGGTIKLITKGGGEAKKTKRR